MPGTRLRFLLGARFLLALLPLMFLPRVASAELDDLSLNTLEHAVELEKTRGLRLLHQVETVRVARKTIRDMSADITDPLDPRPGLIDELPLFQRLGLVPFDAEQGQVLAQRPWPLLGATFVPAGKGGRISLVREEPLKQLAAAHRFGVGLALLSHHHKQHTAEGVPRDQWLARTALRLGDAAYAWLLSSNRDQPEDMGARLLWAKQQLESQLVEPPRVKELGFVERYLRALHLDGIAAVVEYRGTASWDGVNELYHDGHPRSTAHLLHPARMVAEFALRSVEAGPVAVLADRGEPTVGTLGELRTRLWLEQWLDETTAARAAAGWSGDQYALYAPVKNDEPGTATLVLLTTFDELDEPSADEARDYAGAIEALLVKRFRGELQPLALKSLGANAWTDSLGLALLVELRDDKVLYIEGCPEEGLETLREQVWESWRVARPVLGIENELDDGPPPPIAPMATAPPWYRRTPGIVALVLWLVVILPLGSYLATRGGLSPVKVYLGGLLATVLLIGLGWIIGL